MAAAGEALEGIVIASGTDERADDGELVHHPGDSRHKFADFDAGDIRGDRPKFSPHFARGIRLEIDHVLMRRAPRQVDHDHRLLARRRPGRLLGPEDVGERQPGPGGAEGGEATDAEKLPAATAVAEPAGGSARDREHGGNPVGDA